jgi:hypothetical protein
VIRTDRLSELMTRFLVGVDQQDAAMVRAVLAEDVRNTMVLGGQRMDPPPGREPLIAYLAEFWKGQKDQRRHVLSNAIVESDSPREPVMSFYLTLYATQDRKLRPVATGRYVVHYRVDGEEARIRSIELTLDGPFD